MILTTISKMLLQEHRYRPITGRLLCLGPQTIPLHRGYVDALFAAGPEEAERAMEEWRRNGADPSHVKDEYFFHKFPIDRLDSLDVVEGFGGTIIHDLNVPIPEQYHEQFDFIVDGGTFDHLIQLGTAFRNVIRMLKPGGRVLHYNAASGYMGVAYVVFGPDLFYDYYLVNRFADSRVYIARGTGPHTEDPFDMFYLPEARTKHLNSPVHQMVVCIAEKAQDSTWDAIPVEYGYRTPELRDQFARYRERALASTRPLLKCETPLLPLMRETLKRWRHEAAYAWNRIRGGKFNLRKYIESRPQHLAGTGYQYLGRL